MEYNIGDIVQILDSPKRIGFIKEIDASGMFPIVLEFFDRNVGVEPFDHFNVSPEEIKKL
jgi:hypothetical protein